MLAEGKAVYAESCLSCHRADGGGVSEMNPPLRKSSNVLGNKTKLVKVMLYGLRDVNLDGQAYANVMPAYHHLSDQEIAAVLTFIRASFGNEAPPVGAEEVKTVRAAGRH